MTGFLRAPACAVAIAVVLACSGDECLRGNASCAPAVTEPPPLAEPRLVVTSSTDLVNGDLRSPAHLVAMPGTDGISLREAIHAINGTAVPFEITFGAALDGRTITLLSPLPFLRNTGAQVIGPDSLSVTLSGAGITVCCDEAMLIIAASNVTVKRLRFRDLTDMKAAIRVFAGLGSGAREGGGPQVVSNVRIEDNRFDNSPHTTTAYAVRIGMDHQATSARITGVAVSRNAIHHFRAGGSSVMVHANGVGSVIEDVDIHDNTFSECTWCIELVHPSARNGIIRNTRVIRNRFSSSDTPVALAILDQTGLPQATGNLISRTLLHGNHFMGNRRHALIAGGGSATARSNAITSLWFVNNVVANNGAGLLIWGGNHEARDNRVDTVRILHNTFYGSTTAAALGTSNNMGLTAVGNTLTNLVAANNIFWSNVADFGGTMTSAQVRQSITAHAGYAGVNGNLNANPRFIADAAGDFRLSADSPAINAGTATCTTLTDCFCTPRVGAPDLGAFESGAAGSICGAALPSFPTECASLRFPFLRAGL